MHAPSRRIAVVAAAVLSLGSGCASIVHGPKQTFSVTSDPPGAELRADGLFVGTTPFNGKIDRGRKVDLELSLDGYKTASVRKLAKMSPWAAGNLVSFFIPGVVLDFASGAYYEFPDPEWSVTLEREDPAVAAVADPPVLPNPPDSASDRRLDFLRRMFKAGAMTSRRVREEVALLDISEDQRAQFLSELGIDSGDNLTNFR